MFWTDAQNGADALEVPWKRAGAGGEMRRGALRAAPFAVLVAAVVVIVLLASSGGTSHPRKTAGGSRSPAAPAKHAGSGTAGGGGAARGAGPTVVVDPTRAGNRVQPGFLGLSMEFWAVEAYAGKHPNAINPVFVQLVRNLIPDQVGVLRIGGVTTDHTWWPVKGVTPSPAFWYSLDPSRLAVMKSVAEQVGAKLILGITFEANSRKLAAAEGRAMVAGIGAKRIAAFELGNEPELYGNPYFVFYTHDGKNVIGRPASYGMSAFTSNFANIASGLPPLPVAGPAVGDATWLANLNQFIAEVPRLGVITVHRYPFEACTGTPASVAWPTIQKMLSPLSTIDAAQGVVPWVKAAHAHGLPIRIGEMNNTACGNPPGIPNTFAMALWALDTLYSYVDVGVDGVNVHTYPGAIYNLFKFKKRHHQWFGSVNPEYYGLLMFAQGAPAGSHLVAASSANPAVRVWATRAADGSIRVTLINDSLTATQHVSIGVNGTSSPGSFERLVAPSPSATSGVTIGGQSFGRTATGVLAHPPGATPIFPVRGRYSLDLPPASAALLALG